jgi:hypothetical protein
LSQASLARRSNGPKRLIARRMLQARMLRAASALTLVQAKRRSSLGPVGVIVLPDRQAGFPDGMALFDFWTYPDCDSRFVAYKEDNMDATTILIIIIIVLLVGGGGWYGRGRWF